jgi:hypothetical protein
MATKTKADLERELRAEREKATKALTDLQALKKKIPEEISRCNDQYRLDLCDEGIQDFCKALGVEAPSSREDNWRVTISVGSLNLLSRPTSWGGHDIDDEELAIVEKALREAVEGVLSKLPNEIGAYAYMEFDDWDQY